MIAALGDLFESLQSAPRLERLHGVLNCWRDWDAASTWTGRGGSVSIAVGATPANASSYEIWLDHVGERFRWDSDGSVVVGAGDRQTSFDAQSGALIQPRETGLVWPNMLWEGRALLTVGDVVDVTEVEMLGRPAWTVRVDRSPVALLSPNPLWIIGDRVGFTVDQVTGVVLRYAATTADGDPLIEASWTQLQIDEPIGDAVFEAAIPEGVVPRTHSEMLFDQMSAEGVDLSGVDRSDEQAVGEAWQALNRSRRRGGFRSTPEEVLAQYLPDGPPPADPTAAEAAIVAAFAEFARRDGNDMPFVEHGSGLASTLDDLAARSSYRTATIAVTTVRFLNDHQAVAMTNLSVDGNNQLLSNMVHRAVLEHGQWKLARSSFAKLLGLAGVALPPPKT